MHDTIPQNTVDVNYFFPDKLIDPICNSYRDHLELIRVKRELPSGKFEYRYIDCGCGKTYYCLFCGQSYQEKKFSVNKSLFSAIWNQFPNIPMVHLVLTVPHDHILHTTESRKSYSELFKLARNFVDEIYPGSASLMVLHNWSSSEPDKAHIHIHAMIICMDLERNVQTPYIPEHRLKVLWQSYLQYPDLPVLHIEYFYKVNEVGFYHALNYNLRSPIQDWCKDGRKATTSKYRNRMLHLHGVHRARWSGWLGNRVKLTNLAAMGIVKEEYLNEDGWQYDGRVSTTELLHGSRVSTGWCSYISADDIISSSQLMASTTYLLVVKFTAQSPPDT